MIKATELRIGNLVQYQTSNGFAHTKVTSINEKGIDLFVDDYTRDIRVDLEEKDICPISLTEEWLLKLGARHVDGIGYQIRLGAAYLTIRLNAGKTYAEIAYGGLYIGEIESFHRLQNIVHALTGKDLLF